MLPYALHSRLHGRETEAVLGLEQMCRLGLVLNKLLVFPPAAWCLSKGFVSRGFPLTASMLGTS